MSREDYADTKRGDFRLGIGVDPQASVRASLSACIVFECGAYETMAGYVDYLLSLQTGLVTVELGFKCTSSLELLYFKYDDKTKPANKGQETDFKIQLSYIRSFLSMAIVVITVRDISNIASWNSGVGPGALSKRESLATVLIKTPGKINPPNVSCTI
eukprot:scaffold1111_cov65-Attheya_sp.AAC.3